MDTHRTIEAVWHMEAARVIAALARITGDVGRAEELAQDALVAALEQWPKSGVPENPGAWLMQSAKHRAIDEIRHNQQAKRKHAELGRQAELRQAMVNDADLDDEIGDSVLSLIFTACHPVLSQEARVTLTLRLLGGLTTDEIARAFLAPEPTIAQRIVRAKKTLSEERVPFEVPRGEELQARLASVLEVIYLIFNEGYSATVGEDWLRRELCDEALRLGRVLAGLMPRDSEVHGLVALMEIQASRLRARIGPNGEPVLLLDQNRTHWDRTLIQRGLAALDQAQQLGGTRGPYALQAAIAACHVRAATADETDWARIVGLYGELGEVMPSPVIELNRAVALSMLLGPEPGLNIIDGLREHPALKSYPWLASARGDLLEKLGRKNEAQAEFRRAAELTKNERDKHVMLARAAKCG
jgi:RNA polymerase sigma factor (sigma-70 family)